MAKSTKETNHHNRKRPDGSGSGFLGEAENDVPIAPLQTMNSTASKYPVEFLKIDSLENKQSMAFPNDELAIKVVKSIRTAIETLNRRKKFVIRRVDNNTWRIWRNDGKRTYKKEFTGNRFVDGEGKPKKDAPKGNWGPYGKKKGKKKNKN